MLPAYKLVIVSIISSIFLLLGLFIYRFIYPKKIIKPLYLVILLSLLPLISILRAGTYESGDLSWHVYTSLSFYHALFDGQIIPRWGGELVNGFGAPAHMLMYILPYYIISLIHFFGLTILSSIKIYLIATYILSGITMFYFVKNNYGSKPGIAAAIFYLFAPYHLVDMHFRVDLGEMAAFVLLPLTFLFIDKIIQSRNPIYFILEGLSVAFLILSHQAISLFFVPFIITYAILKIYTNKAFELKTIILCITSIISGILLSSFYWFPILFEATKYTNHGQVAPAGKVFFYDISWYLISPWRWGFLFQGPSGQLSFIIGYTQIAIVILAIFFLLKKIFNKKDQLLLRFLLISFFLTFFIMLPQSNFIWDIVPLAKYTLHTYRYLLIISFFCSIIAGIVIKYFKNRFFIILICFITISYTILNWGNRRTIPTISADSYFENGIPTYQGGILDGYFAPLWINTKKTSLQKPSSHLEVLSGNTTVKEVFRSSLKHKYIVNAVTATKLKENTIYFPGWLLRINNHLAKINYEDKGYPGIIVFYVPKGLHKIELKFQNTPIRTLGDALSLITLIVLFLFFFFGLKKFRFIFK